MGLAGGAKTLFKHCDNDFSYGLSDWWKKTYMPSTDLRGAVLKKKKRASGLNKNVFKFKTGKDTMNTS